MKLAIEESVLRQALSVLEDRAVTDTDCESITALRSAIEAAEKVEPVCEHQYIGAGLQPKFWRCLKCGEVNES